MPTMVQPHAQKWMKVPALRQNCSMCTSWILSPKTPSDGLARVWQRLLGTLALAAIFITQPALAQVPDLQVQVRAQPLAVNAETRPVRADPAFEFLIDGSGQLTAEQIEQQPDTAFKPFDPDLPSLLGGATLWLRFDASASSPNERRRLAIPMSTLDEARLYYRNTAGAWVIQQSGDHLPRSSWAQRGRYPMFDLPSGTAQTVRYYLQIRQLRMPYSTLPQILSEEQYIDNRQNDHTLLGIYFGFTLVMLGLAIFNAASTRDPAFGIFALQVLLFGCAQAAYTGLAGLYVWPRTPALNDIATVLLTLSAAAAALWFARSVCTPKRYSLSLDRLILVLIFLLPIAGIVDIALSTPESFVVLNMLVALSMSALVIGIGVALYEGDRDTRWVALGFSPLLLSALFPLARNLGLISSGFWTEYGRIFATMIEMPILFYGLWRRVSQTRSLGTRTTALRNTDPLTGLHSTKVLLSKMRKSLAVGERYEIPFALLLINLSNLAGLQKQHGREIADRAMVMAASRIRRVAQLTDLLARVGDSQFALLMEGPVNLESVNNVATKILASGLRPSNQLPNAEALMFHIVVGQISHDTAGPASQAEARLAHMLQAVQAMNDGSGKAIRLLRL